MTTKFAFIFLIICLGIVFNLGCNNEDQIYVNHESRVLTSNIFESEILPSLKGIEKNFFSIDYILRNNPNLAIGAKGRSLNTLISNARLNLYLQNQENSDELLPSLINKVGFPIWEFAFTNYEEPNSISIPFSTLDNDSINGYLIGQ